MAVEVWGGNADGVLQLTATDPTIVLTHEQAMRVTSLLLEFIPAMSCQDELGPAARITLRQHVLDELAPAVQADIERTFGCTVRAELLPD